MQDNGFEAAVEVVHAFRLGVAANLRGQNALDIFPGTVAASQQVLEYKQNLNAVSKRLRSITPNGGTPTGSALATRLELLLRSARKDIVVVVDGQPHYEELPLARAVIAKAQEQGVDVIGIGIGIEVGHLFPIIVGRRERSRRSARHSQSFFKVTSQNASQRKKVTAALTIGGQFFKTPRGLKKLEHIKILSNNQRTFRSSRASQQLSFISHIH